MDTILLSFHKNKFEFLKDFGHGRIEINPLVIGLIFSYSQKEIKDSLDLILCLDRIIYNSTDNTQKNDCLVKFFDIFSRYLLFTQEAASILVDYFFKFGMILSDTELVPVYQEKISNNFTLSFKSLIRMFCKTDHFIRIYKTGKKNLKILKDFPDIFSTQIEVELDIIEKIQLGIRSIQFVPSLEKLCLDLEPIRKTPEIIDYLLWKINTIYKNTSDAIFSDEILCIQEKFHKLFPDLYENTPEVPKQSALALDASSEIKPVEKISVKEIKIIQKPYTDDIQDSPSPKKPENLSPNKLQLKIPVKSYDDDDDLEVKQKPKSSKYIKKSQNSETAIKHIPKYVKKSEIPKTIIKDNPKDEKKIDNSEKIIKEKLEKSINDYKAQWEPSKDLDTSAISTQFNNIRLNSKNFERSLFCVIDLMIIDDNTQQFKDFWSIIIESAEEFLDPPNFQTLKKNLNGLEEQKTESEYFISCKRGTSGKKTRFRMIDSSKGIVYHQDDSY
jgi:hypothetical protein